jgi:ATP-dependent DNA helicase RecQ
MRRESASSLSLCQALHQYFCFTSFRPGQEEAIHNLLIGRNTLVVMPTGAGKSLIYQLAALLLPGTTLVISPLIALMKDQVDSLARHNIPATCINSALPTNEQARRLRALAEGAFRLAYVAPERLRSTPFQEALRHITVSQLAVDEAHCISQWGHDFRPDYLHIAPARSQMGDPVTVALTATATPQVQDDIVRLLGLPTAQRIVTGFNRSNLTFEVRYTPDLAAKLQALQDLFADLDDGAAIVYVGTRRDAEEVAEFGRTVCGVEAQHYHAGLDTETRTRVQEAFLAGNLPIVVATNAFGMGIDRPDVRLVAHYTLPGTLEAYYQEAGRAGRDGEAARAVLLYAPQDRALQEWFIENDAPTPEETRALYETLRGPGRAEMWLTTDDLSLATGLPEVKVKVGLAQLETAGAVQRLGDAGLRMLLRPGPWDETAVRATAAVVEERRRHRRAQLAQMIAYTEANSCRRRILLNHFGDHGPAEAPRCCDNCLSRQITTSFAPAGEVSSLSQAERTALIILDALRRLKWEVGQEKLAKLLKGSRAKDMQQFSYDQSVYYGRLAVFSLQEIRDLIGQLLMQGYLKVVGGELPVLRLTPQGEAALKARAAITLHLPRGVSPEAVARRQTEREAGGTVALTAQMFAQGLTPAEIVTQRGLSEGTIYSHLARLIGEGAVSLSAVVPQAIAAQVRAAIAQVGDVSALAPIKARLPDDISYGQIRCVVEAWRREQGSKGAEEQGSREGVGELTEMQQVILACVRSLPAQLPRSGIAKLLVGSSSARVEALREHPFDGWLSGWGRGEVMHEVDKLIEQGCLVLNVHGKVMPGAAVLQEEIHRQDLTQSRQSPADRVRHAVQLGEARSPSGVPELIAALQDPDGNVRRLAASALGKIGDRRAVDPLMALLTRETKPQVRQYAVKALGQIGDPRARTLLEKIAADKAERDYTQAATRVALKRLSAQTISENDVTAFLSRPHPRPLTGPWHAGWALGFHSRFAGAEWSRSPVGELAYRLKYQNDLSALPPLVEQALALCAEYPELADVDALVPVPPSTPHPFDPVSALADALGTRLERPVRPVLVKTRETKPQKEMHTLAQKRANVAGAFAVQGDVRGQRLLVLDDLYDSGETLKEVTRVLKQAEATAVMVLTLTRTIHSDT